MSKEVIKERTGNKLKKMIGGNKVDKYLKEVQYVYVRKRLVGRNKILNLWENIKWLIVKRIYKVYKMECEGIKKIPWKY